MRLFEYYQTATSVGPRSLGAMAAAERGPTEFSVAHVQTPDGPQAHGAVLDAGGLAPSDLSPPILISASRVDWMRTQGLRPYRVRDFEGSTAERF